MQPLLGWWQFDPASPAVVRTTTGQTVRYTGRPTDKDLLRLAETGNRRWMRFDYNDREVRYPVLVEWRNVPSPESGRPLVWRVDHIRSAALWRLETGACAVHPPYGLWRRVDDCLTDALACWPSDRLTGAKPKYIAWNGGWLNGAWTAELYRCIWGSTPLRHSAEAYQQAFLPPLDAQPPSPWRLIQPDPDAPESGPGEQGLPAKLGTKVGGAMRQRPYLRSGDGRRLLVALPPGERASTNLIQLNRLFYADEELITDAMGVGIDTHHGAPTWTAYQPRGQSYAFLDRITGLPLPRVSHTTRFSNGLVSSGEDLPHAVNRRLAQACLEALLLYPDGEWLLPVPADTGSKATPKPRKTIIVNWKLGGSISGSRLEAVRSLADSPPEQRNSLTHMFDDTNDGIARGIESFRTRGCWTFDPASKSLINDLSSQRIQFCGSVNDSRSATGAREWRFRYQDQDIEYPLIVSAQQSSRDGTVTSVWSLDHQRSAAIWRAGNQSDLWPPYGLWRRVNDCAIDALLCWPEVAVTGQVPWAVVSVAGWFNGTWSPHIRRHTRHGAKFGFTDAPTVPPHLEDLRASPLSWRYIGAPGVARHAGLANVREFAPDRLYLPAEHDLTGFEHWTPHLVRSDGRAVMFPAGLRSSLYRGEDYDPGAFFLYADGDVFFHFKGRALGGLSGFPSRWVFKAHDLADIGLRHADLFDVEAPGVLPAAFFCKVPDIVIGTFVIPVLPMRANPSLPLWRKVSMALTDGWLAWEGTPTRLLDDPDRLMRLKGGPAANVPPVEQSGIDLRRKSVVDVEGGYIGGRFTTTCVSAAWLQNETPGAMPR